VEFPEPYGEDVRAIRAALVRNGLRQVQFNLPWGDDAAGEVGIANNPRRRVEFRDGVSRALEVADQLGCPRLLCHVGITLPDVPLEAQRASVAENLRYAAEQSARAEVCILVEPLNPIDVPGFLLPTMAAAMPLLNEVGHENLRILCDVYHLQRAGGNLTETILANLDRIEHFEIADCPGRHQPGTVRSTIGSCSTPSTAPASTVGSARNTCRSAARRPLWAGCAIGDTGSRQMAGR
jgi:hydroxypyruvate isomerase